VNESLSDVEAEGNVWLENWRGSHSCTLVVPHPQGTDAVIQTVALATGSTFQPVSSVSVTTQILIENQWLRY
jgi:hypothetical protein